MPVFTDLGQGDDPGKTKKLYCPRCQTWTLQGNLFHQSPTTRRHAKEFEFSNCMNVRQPSGGHFKEVLRPLRLITSSQSQLRLAGGIRDITPQERRFLAC